MRPTPQTAKATTLTTRARCLAHFLAEKAIPGKRWSKWRWAAFFNQEGNSLVEFAIVLPMMMTLLTGTASFSMGLYSFQQLGNATSAAAQQLGAQAGTIADPCNTTFTTVTSALPNWTASKLSYTVTITNASGTVNTYSSGSAKGEYGAGSAFSCTAGAAEMAPNEPVVVQVTYAYTWFPILDFSPSSPITATEAALME